MFRPISPASRRHPSSPAPLPMPKALILYAHPAAELSRTNRLMLEAAARLPDVLIHDLYEHYPDFHVDVANEQQLLSDADLVVLQHPIHWYGMPALQQLWLEQVLARGWAFGHDGNALHGKRLWLVASTGGEAAAYSGSGRHGHPFADFLPPYQQTARLCGMQWLDPLILHGAHHVPPVEFQQHVERYLEGLQA